jgi:hypothetical protein
MNKLVKQARGLVHVVIGRDSSCNIDESVGKAIRIRSAVANDRRASSGSRTAQPTPASRGGVRPGKRSRQCAISLAGCKHLFRHCPRCQDASVGHPGPRRPVISFCAGGETATSTCGLGLLAPRNVQSKRTWTHSRWSLNLSCPSVISSLCAVPHGDDRMVIDELWWMILSFCGVQLPSSWGRYL